MAEHVLGIRAAPLRVRSRRPAVLAGEMRKLRDERGVRIVLVQGNDLFPLRGRWVRELAGELAHAGLIGELVWGITCRAEDVDAQQFGALRDAGLFLVALSATDAGDGDAAAIATLKALGLLYAYDVEVRDHVAFLRSVMGDGSAAPPVASGAWRGLSQRLNRAWVEVTVIERLIGHLDGMARYRRELAALTAASNEELFRHGEEPGAEHVVAQLDEELARIRNAFVVRHRARV
jgi:hypothetical protein